MLATKPLRVLIFALCAAAALGTTRAYAADTDAGTTKGTVFVVMGIDAETRQLASLGYHQILTLIDYDTLGTVGKVMREDFRNSYIDSYGGVLQFTWFALTHEAYCESDQRDGTIIFEKLKSYAKPMAAYGDMVGWHYPNADWDSADTSLGHGRWHQRTTFDGTKYHHGPDTALAEQMAAMVILKQGIYPNVFRSGWNWQNNQYSAWLDDITPFDFSNVAPMVGIPNDPHVSPNGSDYDWSQAPSDWSWYHPNRENYQMPGDMKRTIFRTMPAHRQSELDLGKAFALANQGHHVLVGFYTHSYDDLEKFCRIVRAGLELGTQQFPGVFYKYVTALEGARRMLSLTDMTPPKLAVFRQKDVVVVTSDKPLFAFPYGAILDSSGNYRRVRPMDLAPDETHGAFAWTFDLTGIPYVEFAAGCCDQSGNFAITEKIKKQTRSDR